MSAEQIEGVIGLTVIGAGLVAMVCGVIADARAQKAHEQWQERWSDWLTGGMKGPRP